MFRMSVSEANEYRHFCSNELSAMVDNDGGVCFLNLIDCFYWKGQVFPDQWRLPILSRDIVGDKNGCPEYGAGVQLYTQETDGRVLLHRPAEQRFTLSYLEGGDENQTYQLLLDNNRLLWECACASDKRRDLILYLDQRFWYCGKAHTLKDQHRGENSTQNGNHFEEMGIELDVDLPDNLNGTVDVCWQEEPWDAVRGVKLYRCTATYPYETKSYVVAVGADAPMTTDEAFNVTLLRMAWEGRETIHVGIAIAETEEAAIASLREGLEQYETLRKRHLESVERHEQAANCVSIEALPFAEAYGRATGAYLDALMVGPTPEGRIGMRASAGNYGYFSLWDAIYPIRDLLWNGRYAEAARMLKYLFSLPAMENTPLCAMHLVVEWNEAMAFLPSAYREDFYPQIAYYFCCIRRLAEPQYGLLQCKCNTGVDKTKQMGLDGLFLSPDVNGWWYSFCRIVRNEALRHGDEETAAQAAGLIETIEVGFRRVFFNEDVGYLRAGAKGDLSPADIEVYHNSLTLGYDYPYGMYLMRDIADRLAHYQSHQLYHPFGHRAVSFDSAMPSGWWKFVHMNQHNGHEMKLQRTANNMAEIYRVMGEVMKRSDRWKNAEETTNFSRFSIHPDQVCDWQTFAATAQMEALRAGVAGILRHRGGLQYLPATDSGTVRVAGVPIGEDRITITVSGSGSFAVLKCGGKTVKGTLQLPLDVAGSDVRVCRTDARPTYPVLLSAIDLPIEQVRARGKRLSLVCGDTAYTPMTWAVASLPSVRVNGQEIPSVWDEKQGTVTVDRLWVRGDAVEIITE